ncbi:MAG: hypothetical protein R3C01_01770 [Planctomycetaceae bacterium]
MEIHPVSSFSRDRDSGMNGGRFAYEFSFTSDRQDIPLSMAVVVSICRPFQNRTLSVRLRRMPVIRERLWAVGLGTTAARMTMIRAMAMFLAVLLGAASQASAQSQASNAQQFQMHVPPVLTGRVNILAPADVQIAHDITDDDQYFPDQLWDAGCNANNGALVVFETRSAFRSSGGGPPDKRDARLDISLLSAAPGSGWVVTVPTATTNYRGGNAAERVATRAESFAPGTATFRVNVAFITEDAATLKMGSYNMRVTGTITAK